MMMTVLMTSYSNPPAKQAPLQKVSQWMYQQASLLLPIKTRKNFDGMFQFLTEIEGYNVESKSSIMSKKLISKPCTLSFAINSLDKRVCEGFCIHLETYSGITERISQERLRAYWIFCVSDPAIIMI